MSYLPDSHDWKDFPPRMDTPDRPTGPRLPTPEYVTEPDCLTLCGGMASQR
ncbi:hypothetical protein GCM10022226_47230 [Sphaerisporangium flaviroseum]|uniref:Uncharacterized protein n=1 Tax=Sphaerisporangium flaviroseum TaxID=509199 RepID=A0ABP7ILE7_9ACTN